MIGIEENIVLKGILNRMDSEYSPVDLEGVQEIIELRII